MNYELRMSAFKVISRSTTAFLLVMILFAPGRLSATSLDFYEKKIYKAYIADDMGLWKTTMEKMEQDDQKDNSDKFLLHLAITQYGYTGYLLGNNKKDQARKLMDKTLVNAEKLKTTSYKAEAYALLAGLNGYEIGLAKYKAPFLGKKSEKYTDKSLEISEVNPMGWTEKGNIYYHMPGFFGGSYDKAIQYYSNAIKNFDKTDYLPKWLKLNAMVWLGKAYEAKEEFHKASETYKKALRIEPNFSWVKNTLYPELLEKM